MRPPILSLWLSLVLFSLTIGCVVSKECTDIFPQNFHALRYELQITKNVTWKEEMLSKMAFNLNGSLRDSFRASLLPRRMMRQEDGMLPSGGMEIYKKTLNERPKGYLKEVSLKDVRIDPDTMYGKAMQTQLEYLLMFDVDNLVWNFRKNADLPAPGHPYGGWEAPTNQLRGHFVGHYMSSTALMWASTNNATLKERMDRVVSALSEVQSKLSKGYLAAFPSTWFEMLENLEPIWAPYYTIHKIMAGLLDQYTIAQNEEALQVIKGMADYHYHRVQRVIQKYTVQRHWDMLNEEAGGMNDVLYRLYAITGDPKNLWLAHMFDKPCFLGELAMKADDIATFHANTHIPVVTGAQMRHEIVGDPLYRDLSIFFLNVINASHTYATGGSNDNEHWTTPDRLALTLNTENEETCTTYNILKVARNLFRWTKELKYADFYERALINGILPVQRGREPGIMIYMLPLMPGASKAISFHGWGSPFNSTWCCYGTGMESFSKLGDTIYFEDEGEVPGLFIIQYIPNSFTWRSGGVELKLDLEPVVSWSNDFHVTVTVSSGKATTASNWHLRMPIWTDTKAAKAELLHGDDQKNQILTLPATGNYLSISKKWVRGDKISINFPLSLRLEAIRDTRPEAASIHAILYGPYLLAGLSNGDWDIIKASADESLTDWISPIQADYNNNLISLSQASGNAFLAASLDSVGLQNSPEPGTNDAVNATIRLILKEPEVNISSPKDAIGKSVMLEPYGLPGMLLAHQGSDKPFHLIPSSSDESSVFNLVAGLDKVNGKVSLESASQKGCYMISGSANSITLGCKTNTSNDRDFNEAASFKMDKGISEYHPISFVAKGANRNFLLVPLLSIRDEHYTVYFNITA